METNLIGQYVIVRSDKAGIFFGVLVNKEGQELTLQNARKIYYFSGANTVEDIADKGLMNPEDSNVTVAISIIILAEFVQILPCTESAILNLKSQKVWQYQH